MSYKKKIQLVKHLDEFSSLSELAVKCGYRIHTEVLEYNIIEANRYLSKYLKVPIATELFQIERLRFLDDIPCTIETSYIPCHRVIGIKKINFEDQSLYEILEQRYDIRVKKAEEELLLIDPGITTQNLLNLSNDDKVLMIRGITFDDTEQIIEYSENISLTDLYIFKG